MIIDLLQFLSCDESDSIDDESDEDGSYSGYTGTCAFSCCFEESAGHVDDTVGSVGDSVGRVRGVGYGVFVLVGIKSIGDVVPLVLFVPIAVESKSS